MTGGTEVMLIVKHGGRVYRQEGKIMAADADAQLALVGDYLAKALQRIKIDIVHYGAEAKP
jgi:hypothetical protein